MSDHLPPPAPHEPPKLRFLRHLGAATLIAFITGGCIVAQLVLKLKDAEAEPLFTDLQTIVVVALGFIGGFAAGAARSTQSGSE